MLAIPFQTAFHKGDGDRSPCAGTTIFQNSLLMCGCRVERRVVLMASPVTSHFEVADLNSSAQMHPRAHPYSTMSDFTQPLCRA